MTELRDADELRAFIDQRGPFGTCVWDFDGVICDSEPFQAQAYRDVLLADGIDPPADFFAPYVGLTEPEIWTGIAARHGIRTGSEDLMRRRFDALRPLLLGAHPNWFVRPVLAALAASGATSVVVSSGNSSMIEAYLDAWQLTAAFERVSAFSPGASPKGERIGAVLAAAAGRTLLFEDVERYLALGREQGAVAVGVLHGLNDGALSSADATVRASPEPPGRDGPAAGGPRA